MKNYTADIEVKVGERTKELKKTEEALRLSKAGFYNIVEQSADGVVIIDFAGIVRYVNSATESLLGCREKDILEKQFAFPITRNSSVELNIVRHNREPKVAEMRVVETQWNGGKARLAMLRDISERKKMEKKLKETMAIKAEFTSMVSHELRTPLTAIKEGLALVLDGMVGQINDEQKELLGISKKNVDRLTRLINEVLDFQKLECGKMKFNIKPNNINDTAKDAYEIMLPVAKEKNVSIQLNTDDNLPVVAFDRNKITQVLLNLINNAVKFTDEGTITIKTGQDDFSVLVSIADNGCGIKEKDLPRLFSRFEQLNTGGERRTGGTGLGLAISKEIIEQHKGAIWAESVAGKGSTFTFRLPKHSDAELSEKSTSNTVSEKAPQDGRLAVHTYRLHSDKE
jgi:signal transduction histidine kinase